MSGSVHLAVAIAAGHLKWRLAQRHERVAIEYALAINEAAAAVARGVQ